MDLIARKNGCDVKYARLDFISGKASVLAEGGWVIVPKRTDLKPFLESLPKLANELQGLSCANAIAGFYLQQTPLAERGAQDDWVVLPLVQTPTSR